MGGLGGTRGVWSGIKVPPPTSINAVIDGPFGLADVPRLWDRVRARLPGQGTTLVTFDVAALDRPDAGTVEALARLQLAARRSGCRVRFRNACGELRDLLELMGLAEVLPCSDSHLEPRREVEQGEPPRGVEEERDPVDPVP
jgi:ABC-type transporter Mla MlaB component